MHSLCAGQRASDDTASQTKTIMSYLIFTIEGRSRYMVFEDSLLVLLNPHVKINKPVTGRRIRSLKDLQTVLFNINTQTIVNSQYSTCSVLSQGVQQRATYQQLLLALRPQHGEVDHRSDHHSQHTEHERHQLLSVLLQHAPADVVDAEHCRQTDHTRLTYHRKDVFFMKLHFCIGTMTSGHQ